VPLRKHGSRSFKSNVRWQRGCRNLTELIAHTVNVDVD
jgi:hypothetical protein